MRYFVFSSSQSEQLTMKEESWKIGKWARRILMMSSDSPDDTKHVVGLAALRSGDSPLSHWGLGEGTFFGAGHSFTTESATDRPRLSA
jgi:hypothetical protein